MRQITIRTSGLPRYADCGLAWAVENGHVEIEGGGPPASTPLHVAAAIGTGVHAGAAEALRRKRAGMATDLAHCQARAVAAYHEAVEDAGGSRMMVWDATSKPSDATQQVRRMLRAWMAYRLDGAHPMMIEDRLTAVIHQGNGLEVYLSGQMDAVFMEPGRIVDLKTGGMEPAAQVQLGGYRLLCEMVKGGQIDTLAIDYLPRLPLSKPQTPPQMTYYDPDACMEAAWTVLNQMIFDLQSGDWLANPRSSLCSARWCAAHGTAYCPITRTLSRRG